MILSEFLHAKWADEDRCKRLSVYYTFEEAWERADSEDLLWLATRSGVIKPSTCKRIIYVLIRDLLEQSPRVSKGMFVDELVARANGYDDGDITSVELVNALDQILPIWNNGFANLFDGSEVWQKMKREHATPREILAWVGSMYMLLYSASFDKDAALSVCAKCIRQWVTPEFSTDEE